MSVEGEKHSQIPKVGYKFEPGMSNLDAIGVEFDSHGDITDKGWERFGQVIANLRVLSRIGQAFSDRGIEHLDVIIFLPEEKRQSMKAQIVDIFEASERDRLFPDQVLREARPTGRMTMLGKEHKSEPGVTDRSAIVSANDHSEVA